MNFPKVPDSVRLSRLQPPTSRVRMVLDTDNPATYRQRPDGKESDQRAEAGRIEFHAKEDRIILLENARVWQSGDKELRSERIVFDLKSNTVNAGSNKPGDRVHIILPPDSKQNKSPAPSP